MDFSRTVFLSELPHILKFCFLQVRSYNGHLRFRVHSEGGSRNFPDQILQTYPLVSLQGNWQLVLEYYPPALSPDGRYEVKLVMFENLFLMFF